MKENIFEQVEEIKKIIFSDSYQVINSLSKNDYINFIKKDESLNIYIKNLLALLETNPKLGIKLANTQQEKYEVFVSNDGFYNAINNTTLKYIYENPKEHLKHWQKRFDTEFNRYTALYFYGIGLGNIYKLTPQSIKKIIIFEDDMEILYISFNLYDFSTDLLDKKISIYDKEISPVDIEMLYLESNVRSQVKLYNMLIHSDFYYEFSDNIKYINKKITDEFAKLVATSGNDITDQLIGIQHYITQIPNITKSYSLEKLVQLNFKKHKNVVIVSTGPSLHKQLNLLKQNQDNLCIISVDASLKILLENDIAPDFVTSIERVACTGDFFNIDFKGKLDHTFMIIPGLAHEDLVNNILKNNHSKICMYLKPLTFEKGLDLEHRGYLGGGMSAANIALEFAVLMRAENIVFIGQDLAFGKDGKSHSKGHIYGENEQTTNCHYDTFAKGYYGDTVYTMYVWEMFRSQMQKVIEVYNDINYYNCTEGGAYIEGCKHIPFSDFLKTHNEKKTPISSIAQTNEEIEKELYHFKNYIESIYEYEKQVTPQLKECFLKIADECEKLDKNNKKPNTNKLTKLAQEIDKIKDIVESEKFCKYFMGFMIPRLVSFELDLAKIVAMSVNSEEDKIKKLVDWIYAHKIWLFNICGAIEIMCETIRKNSKNLIDELKSRNLDLGLLEEEYIKAQNNKEGIK